MTILNISLSVRNRIKQYEYNILLPLFYYPKAVKILRLAIPYISTHTLMLCTHAHPLAVNRSYGFSQLK